MPIERYYSNVSITRAIRRVKLKLGAEKPNDRQPGKNLDHFRLAINEDEFTPTEVVAMQQSFEALYGAEPSSIGNVFVLMPRQPKDDSLQAYLAATMSIDRELWLSNEVLYRRCDESWISAMWNDDAKEFAYPAPGQRACELHELRKNTPPGEPAPEECPAKCSVVGRLHFIAPDWMALLREQHGLEIEFHITVETGAENSIAEILSTLSKVAQARGGYGNTPCIISRKKHRARQAVKGKPSNVPVWIVTLQTQENIVLDALQQRAEKLLPATVAELPDVDLELTRARLGAGGNRRIGSGDAQDDLPVEAHWWVTDSRDKFLHWCDKAFLYDEADVEDAFIVAMTIWNVDGFLEDYVTTLSRAKAAAVVLADWSSKEYGLDEAVSEINKMRHKAGLDITPEIKSAAEKLLIDKRHWVEG